MRSVYQRFADLKLVIFLGIIVILWAKFVLEPITNAALPGQTSQLIALQLSFSKEAFIQNFKNADRFNYDFHLYYDNYFCVFYGLFFASIIAWISSRKNLNPSPFDLFLFSVPLIASAADLIENNFHQILLSSKGNYSESIIHYAFYASSVKWFLLAVTILIILGYTLRRIIVRK